ncbi:Sortase family protein [Frankineae bacterium MT45]|nr:Sortase family protein [Frankineae bacterium MT45]
MAARSLIVLAVIAAWAIVYLLFFSHFEESRAQHGLYARFRTELASGDAPLAQPIPGGAPIATLSATSAGIDGLVVVEGTTSAILKDAPGHLPSSVLPGQVGTTVIYGKSVTYGAPFHDINHLRPGAVIVATTGQGTFRYRVDGIRHAGDPAPAAVAGASRLTLETAAGSGFLGSFMPHSVVYVDAVLSGDPVVRTAVATLGPNESAMAIDDSLVSLFELVLALQLVIVLLLATVWVRAKWHFPQVWLAAVPAIAAAAWLAGGVSANLLPNLF